MEVAMAVDTLSFENCQNLGFDCSSEEFQRTDLQLEQQKEYMVSRIMSKFKSHYHDIVRMWNANLKFEEPPEGVEMKSHETISNAWMIAPAVMPSVQEDGAYYVGEGGIVQTVYNYALSLPESYYGKDKTCEEPPQVNEFDDCRTIYTGNKDISQLDVYQDGQLIGHSSLTKFRSNQTNSFESVLSIKNEISMDHYKWEKSGACCQYNYCCWKSGETTKCGRAESCGCETFEKQCKFDSKGTKVDSLQLQSNLYAAKERPLSAQDPEIKLDIAATPQKAIKKINAENLRSYAITTLFQTLKKNFAKYKVGYLYPPQNILYVYADKQESWYTENAELESVAKEGNAETIIFLTDEKRIEGCSITAETHFNSSTQDCDIVYLEESKVFLETDKWFYKENDTIKLTVNLENSDGQERTVLVNYANQSFALKTTLDVIETELAPVAGQSLIIASLEGAEDSGSYTSSISISVYDKRNFTSIIWVIFVIAFMYYGIRFAVKLVHEKNE